MAHLSLTSFIIVVTLRGRYDDWKVMLVVVIEYHRITLGPVVLLSTSTSLRINELDDVLSGC